MITNISGDRYCKCERVVTVPYVYHNLHLVCKSNHAVFNRDQTVNSYSLQPSKIVKVVDHIIFFTKGSTVILSHIAFIWSQHNIDKVIR